MPNAILARRTIQSSKCGKVSAEEYCTEGI